MNKLIWNLLLLTAAIMPLPAQDSAQPPLPGPPYLKAIPSPAQWTKSLQEGKTAVKDGPGVADGRLTAESVTKTALARFDQSKFNDGTEKTRWLSDGCEILKTSAYPDLLVVKQLPPAADSGWLDASDFPELAWISQTKPVSWALYKDRNCLYFENEIADPTLYTDYLSGSTKGRVTIKVKAWIDAETRRPLAIYDGHQTYVYQYSSTPAEVTLPPEVSEKLKEYKARSKALF